MNLYDLSRTFTTSTLSVFCDGKRLWFGKACELPNEYKYYCVIYADAMPRKKYRTNQTDLYAFVKII